jgi:hypothetical protein
MVENGKCKKFAPKPCNKLELVIFLENCLCIVQHGDLEKIGLHIKVLT